MKFNKTPEIHKELSTILPLVGTFILAVAIPALQWGVDMQIIPTEYHATITGVVIVGLGYLGKKISQPYLKRNNVEDKK